MTELIFTGAPRSGTKYLASLFGWGHEKSYGLDTTGPAVEPEVSWLAAPHVSRHSSFVVHLVREPVATVSSIVAADFLREDNAYGRYAYRFVQTWDPWLFWLRWTELAAAAAVATIRLEDIAHLGLPVGVGPVVQHVPISRRSAAAVMRTSARYGY